MISIKKLQSLLILIYLLTGCTSLRTFQKREVCGSEFDKKLVEYYKEFAASESEKYDWVSARRFINKGMALLNGQEIQPEKLKLWNIPKEFLPELVEARLKVVKILNDESILHQKPIQAAKAVYSFDCWVEEQAENWQENDIKACKDNFYAALNEIETPNVVILKNKIDDKVISEIPDHVLTIEVDESKRIYFEFDRYNLTKDASEKLKKIATELNNFRNEISEIYLKGYADKVGSENYNMQLSHKRALEVKKFLEDANIDKDKIKVFAYGFHHPLVKTPAGNREPQNRRVEIIILDK